MKRWTTIAAMVSITALFTKHSYLILVPTDTPTYRLSSLSRIAVSYLYAGGSMCNIKDRGFLPIESQDVMKSAKIMMMK